MKMASLSSRFFRNIKRIFRSDPPIRPTLHQRIQLCWDAYYETEDRIDRMLATLRGRSVCCPSCALGAQYSELAQKSDRQLAWIKILEKKLEKQKLLTSTKN